MTTPATPNAALPLDALGMDVLPEDALAEGPTATAPEATSATRKKVSFLALADVSEKERSTVVEYFRQVYGTRDVRWFTSPESFRDIVAEHSEITRLVVLSHSLETGEPGKRIGLIALGEHLMNLVEVQKLLDGSMPKVDTLIIDGCTIGRAAIPLYDFAAHFQIREIQTWTHFHHIQWWGRPSDDPVEPASDTPSVLQYAAPYVPSGAYGGHVSDTVLIEEFTRTGTVGRLTEFFTYNMEDDLRFEEIMPKPSSYPAGIPPSLEPWTKVRTPEEGRFPRSAAKDHVIDSRGAAEAFEHQSEDKLHYRVRIQPPPP